MTSVLTRALRLAAGAALLCAAASTSAAAQVLERPQRSAGGLFGGPRPSNPNDAQHQLSATLDLLGGWDDNLSAAAGGDGVSADPLAPAASGSTGVATADLRYRYGITTRFVEATARGYMNTFRRLQVRPMYGGEVAFRGSTSVGARAQLTGAVSGQYQPTFQLGEVAASDFEVQSGAVSPADPTAGVSETRSSNFGATSIFSYTWSPRHSTNAGYGYSQQLVTTGFQVNTRSTQLSVEHSWNLQQASAILLSYEFSGHTTDDGIGLAQVVDSHNAQLGLRVRKRLSPTRTIAFSGGAGAMNVQSGATDTTDGYAYVAPSMFGGARLDLGRTWAVSADLRRDIRVIELTRQSFLTDMLSLWLGGTVGRKWVVALTGSMSRGRSHEGEVGSFDSLNGTAQIQYAVSRCCSLLTSYSYYAHRLRDLASLPPGFPDRFDRNTVRAGVTVFLPLYGAFGTGGRRDGSRD